MASTVKLDSFIRSDGAPIEVLYAEWEDQEEESIEEGE